MEITLKVHVTRVSIPLSMYNCALICGVQKKFEIPSCLIVQVQREFLALGDPLIHHSDIVGSSAVPEASHHSASAASFGGVLLLGSQGESDRKPGL